MRGSTAILLVVVEIDDKIMLIHHPEDPNALLYGRGQRNNFFFYWIRSFAVVDVVLRTIALPSSKWRFATIEDSEMLKINDLLRTLYLYE